MERGKVTTTLRTELSKRNPYWIEKHRRCELKHFCLQYPIWKHNYDSLNGAIGQSGVVSFGNRGSQVSNPTERIALEKMFYSERMGMVEKAAKEADPELADYILKGVTEGLSYDVIKARMNIPCCKDVYYDKYRKFFWLLSKERN